jgi:hypothetical protein
MLCVAVYYCKDDNRLTIHKKVLLEADAPSVIFADDDAHCFWVCARRAV